MIHIKTDKEIEIMQHGGHILHDVLFEVLAAVKPGVTELAIDQLAEKLIRARGGEPGFKKVKGYNHTICISTNDVVVHGIPGGYVFKEGDVVGVDCGVFYKGFHTDMSETIQVDGGDKRDEVDMFLKTGKKALTEAIKVAKVGNRIGHISQTIQNIVEKEGGFSIVRSLIGHGVGRTLHEEPEVPGYLVKDIQKTPSLKEGMTIAIEVIYNKGAADIVLDRDGWTIRTKDGSLGGLFERTVAVKSRGPLILTA